MAKQPIVPHPLVLAPGLLSKSQGVEGQQLFFYTFGGSKTRGGGLEHLGFLWKLEG